MLHNADADVSNCGSIEERSQKPTPFVQRDGTYVCTSFLSASNRSSDHMPQGPLGPPPPPHPTPPPTLMLNLTQTRHLYPTLTLTLSLTLTRTLSF